MDGQDILYSSYKGPDDDEVHKKERKNLAK